MFRSYNAFTPKKYKILMWICYPLLATICCILVQSGCFGKMDDPGYHFIVTASILCSCMTMVECIADYWLFSGIQSKNANHMDFIKGSKYGMAFFRNAMTSDVLRRALVITFCHCMNAVIGVTVFHYSIGGADGLCQILIYLLSCYFTSTIGVFISRFGDTWIMNFACGYGFSFLMVLLNVFIYKVHFPLWILVLVFLAASVLISIIAVNVAMKKVEDSYYDQRS